MRRARTIRLRLTLIYGGVFLISTAALLTVGYLLVRQNLLHHHSFRDEAGGLGAARFRQLFGAPPLPPDSAVRAFQAGYREAVHAALHRLLLEYVVALIAMTGISVALGWWMAGRVLSPLRKITATARRVSGENLGERIALDGPQDELKELGDTLDDLFGRLDAAFEAQRQFVANASHELRTPLARQRALIQVALSDPQASFSSLRSAHERVLASEQHLEQMIDALLTLTRGQAGLERREPLDLAAVAAHALRAREMEAAARQLEVRATLAPAPTAGDPRLIERLITNLIDNAMRHNTTDGHLEVTTDSRDRHAVLSIANTGPPVPPEEIRRLFQPFQRLDGARTRQHSGHGLGLSIVYAIAQAHRAEVSARARSAGGLTIEVTFPPAGRARAGPTSTAARTKPDRPAAVLRD